MYTLYIYSSHFCLLNLQYTIVSESSSKSENSTYCLDSFHTLLYLNHSSITYYRKTQYTIRGTPLLSRSEQLLCTLELAVLIIKIHIVSLSISTASIEAKQVILALVTS
jgi:hypothetical protein